MRKQRILSVALAIMLAIGLFAPGSASLAAGASAVLTMEDMGSLKSHDAAAPADYRTAEAIESATGKMMGKDLSQNQLEALTTLRSIGRTGGLVAFEGEYALDSLSGTTGVIVEFVNQPAEVAVIEGALMSRKVSASAADKAAAADHVNFEKALAAMFGQSAQSKSAPYQITASYHNSINGVALRLPASRIAELAELDMVFAVYPDLEMQIDTQNVVLVDENTPSDPQGLLEGREAMNVTELHEMGINGTGVVVGVIDTGVDYNHPDIAPAYIGGRNFVQHPGLTRDDNDPMETSYDDWLASGDPEFDDDGNEFYTSHGTHVSSTIVGQGLNTPISALGIAPGAKLRGYRTLGPYGSGDTSWTLSAIDVVVEDGCDVVNLSLGNSTNHPYFITSIAINNVVLASDVVFAISAGNRGPNSFTLGSPGTAALAITVGWATADVPNAVLGIDANGQNFDLKSFYHTWDTTYTPNDQGTYTINYTGNGLDMNDDGKYKVVPLRVDANNVPVGTGVLADWEAADPDAIRNNFVLVMRGATFTETMAFAREYGAGGLIIVNSTTGVYSTMNYRGGGDEYLPFYSIPNAEGLAMWAAIKDSGGYISITELKPIVGLEMNEQSSRGPAAQTYELKPDVVSHGDSVLAAYPYYMFPGNREDRSYTYAYARISGTSMSSPHVAGAAALLRSYNPDWSAAEIKARLIGSAYELNDNYSVYEVGAGFVDAKAAIELTGFATVEAEVPSRTTGSSYEMVPATLSSLSFGLASTGTAMEKTLKVTVHNTTDSYAMYAVSIVFNTEDTANGTINIKTHEGVTITTDNIFHPGFAMNPNSTKDISFTMNISEALTADDAGSYEGYIRFDSEVDPSASFRIPFAAWVIDGSGEPQPGETHALFDRAIVAPGGAEFAQIKSPTVSYRDRQFSRSHASDTWFTAGKDYSELHMIVYGADGFYLGEMGAYYTGITSGGTWRLLDTIKGYYRIEDPNNPGYLGPTVPFEPGLYYMGFLGFFGSSYEYTFVPFYVDDTPPTFLVDNMTDDNIIYYAEGTTAVSVSGTLYDAGYEMAKSLNLPNKYCNTENWGWDPDNMAVFAQLGTQIVGGLLNYTTGRFSFNLTLASPTSEVQLDLIAIDYFHPTRMHSAHGVTAVPGIDLTRPCMSDHIYLQILELPDAGFYGANMDTITVTIKPEPVVEPVDKSALIAAIAQAQALNPDDYIDFFGVAEALAAAIAVRDNNDATQDEVDAATAALLAAIAALELKPEPVDKAALIAAIEQAQALNPDDYIDFFGVAEALAAAIAVRDNDDATQAEVDAATAALLAAIDALELKPAILDLDVSLGGIETLVDGLSAYLRITVSADESIDDLQLTAYLLVNGEELYPTELVNGTGRMYIPAAPAVGSYQIIVKGEGAQGSAPISVLPYNPDIWTVSPGENPDGVFLRLFAKATVGSALVNKKAASFTLEYETVSGGTNTLVKFGQLTPGAYSFELRKVKLTELFPSYTFTYKATYNVQ